jgi:hypothetical protein
MITNSRKQPRRRRRRRRLTTPSFCGPAAGPGLQRPLGAWGLGTEHGPLRQATSQVGVVGSVALVGQRPVRRARRGTFSRQSHGREPRRASAPHAEIPAGGGVLVTPRRKRKSKRADDDAHATRRRQVPARRRVPGAIPREEVRRLLRCQRELRRPLRPAAGARDLAPPSPRRRRRQPRKGGSRRQLSRLPPGEPVRGPAHQPGGPVRAVLLARIAGRAPVRPVVPAVQERPSPEPVPRARPPGLGPVPGVRKRDQPVRSRLPRLPRRARAPRAAEGAGGRAPRSAVGARAARGPLLRAVGPRRCSRRFRPDEAPKRIRRGTSPPLRRSTRSSTAPASSMGRPSCPARTSTSRARSRTRSGT